MRILVIADPKIPVPPREYGGAERIVDFLCTGLQRAGHDVDLLAAPGSSRYGGRLCSHGLAGSSWLSRGRTKLRFQALSWRAARGVDVIVNHGRPDYLEALLRTSIPLIHVFHNPVMQHEVDWLVARRRQKLALVGVSHSQIRALSPASLFSVVHNSTDTEKFQFSRTPAPEPYLAFLGRLTANKGVDTAIRVARRCGLKLRLAGNISDEAGGREFFEQKIKPQLDEQIEWVGPVDDAAKQALLGGARALLFPIRWPEPFGIVMAESLACGTPVIATRCASTSEVIDHGINGFLCDTEEQLVAAVNRLEHLDRAACRESAETKFSVPVMTDGYIEVLERLSSGTKPVAVSHGIRSVRKKRILVIADAKLPVPPKTYGGAERIAAYLCAEFQKAGHHVDLVAGPGSQAFGGRLILHRHPSRNPFSRGFRKLWFQWLSRRAAKGADIVLNFGRIDYLAAVLRTSKPILCRFGNPVRQSELDWIIARRRNLVRFVGVSQYQVRELEPKDLIDVVPNGTDFSRFEFRRSTQNDPYLVFLGRLTSNKGIDTAIRVARRCGMRLKMGGNISDEPDGSRFFEEVVRPQLDSQIEWVGEVDDIGKQELLGGAIALLFPIRWSEPFANVVLESLACGTPVIATRCASAPEAIKHGCNGFLCDSEDEMVAAVARVPSIDRAACRHAAEARFSVRVMAQGYLGVMDQLLDEALEPGL